MPEVDPAWWRTGVHDGGPLCESLARRDIGAVFRFLRDHGWSRARIAAATGMAETRVRSICQGKQLVTSYEVLVRIADGLGIERGLLGLAYSDALEMAQRPAAWVRDPGLNPRFVGSLAALAVGPAPGDLTQAVSGLRSLSVNVPEVVSPAHVRLLQEVRDRHRHIDADNGGGSCRDSAVNYLVWATGMLNSRFDSAATEHELKAALSDMYQVAGWACHDLGDHAAARYYLTAGLVIARDIDDLGLIAGGFYRLGRVSIHQGHAQEALKLWQLGQIVAQDSGNLASVAVLHANEAWAYAMLGAADRVCDALARAEGELARVDTDTVPSWARFFLAPADLDGISGVVYGCLASHREHRRYASMAIQHSERAFELRRAGESRSQTFDAISLATGYLLDAQPDQAERHGHRAVDMTSATISTRAVDRLKITAGLARLHAGHRGVTDVVERVRVLADS